MKPCCHQPVVIIRKATENSQKCCYETNVNVRVKFKISSLLQSSSKCFLIWWGIRQLGVIHTGLCTAGVSDVEQFNVCASVLELKTFNQKKQLQCTALLLRCVSFREFWSLLVVTVQHSSMSWNQVNYRFWHLTKCQNTSLIQCLSNQFYSFGPSDGWIIENRATIMT